MCQLYHQCKPVAKHTNVRDCNHFLGNVAFTISLRDQVAKYSYRIITLPTKKKEDKTDKGHKIRIIDQFNESFQAVFSNEP